MIQISVPDLQSQLRPRITVFGVGGAGGNAVNNMIRAALEGVEFVVANSDSQALHGNLAERKLQLGVNLTRGLGAGAKPEVGRAAAEEQIDEITAYLEGTNMAFITAGMGGGTGTGAAPVIARTAREQGILTVGVVTKPFHFEGSHRMRMAEAGIAELQQYVDTLIIIPNQNLFRIANERTTFADAFRLADEVLHSGVRGVTDLMVMPGLINLDFADIRSVMSEMGKAMMGTGEASGEKRSVQAAEAAIANPLLDDVSMKGARGVLINITGGYDMTLFEVDEAANRIREEVDPDANIIFGSTFDEKMEGKMRVSVVATGIDMASMERSRSSSGYVAATASGQSTHLRAAENKPSAAEYQPAAARSNALFSPGFSAPAQQAHAQTQKPQMPNPPMHNAASVNATAASRTTTSNVENQSQPQAASQTPSFAAPFSWGLSGSSKASANAAQASVQSFANETGHGPQSAALDHLLEKARAAESSMVEAHAAPLAAPSPQASSYQPQPAPQQQPQQMSMPISMSPQQAPVAPAMAQQQTQPAPQQQQVKRSHSLFARIAELGGGKRHAENAPPAQTQAPATQQATQPRLGIDPTDRPRSPSEEEALDIPAFLRRQSN